MRGIQWPPSNRLCIFFRIPSMFMLWLWRSHTHTHIYIYACACVIGTFLSVQVSYEKWHHIYIRSIIPHTEITVFACEDPDEPTKPTITFSSYSRTCIRFTHTSRAQGGVMTLPRCTLTFLLILRRQWLFRESPTCTGARQWNETIPFRPRWSAHVCPLRPPVALTRWPLGVWMCRWLGAGKRWRGERRGREKVERERKRRR